MLSRKFPYSINQINWCNYTKLKEMLKRTSNTIKCLCIYMIELRFGINIIIRERINNVLMSLGFHFRLNQNIENSQAFPIFENPWSSVKISHINKKYYHKESKANSYWHKYLIDFLTDTMPRRDGLTYVCPAWRSVVNWSSLGWSRQ